MGSIGTTKFSSKNSAFFKYKALDVLKNRKLYRAIKAAVGHYGSEKINQAIRGELWFWLIFSVPYQDKNKKGWTTFRLRLERDIAAIKCTDIDTFITNLIAAVEEY